MRLNAIVSLWNKDCHADGKDVFIEGKLPTVAENKAIDAEVVKLKAAAVIAEFNKTILAKMSVLDSKRIRPLAEGDAAYLATLNQQIVVLRATLK